MFNLFFRNFRLLIYRPVHHGHGVCKIQYCAYNYTVSVWYGPTLACCRCRFILYICTVYKKRGQQFLDSVQGSTKLNSALYQESTESNSTLSRTALHVSIHFQKRYLLYFVKNIFHAGSVYRYMTSTGLTNLFSQFLYDFCLR